MAKTFVTYEPDNSLRKGYFHLFREIIDEIRWNKWLTYQLFRRDFFAMYKQSFVGVFWAFFMPLLSVGTFVMLNGAGVFNMGDVKIPYPLYAIMGMAFWQIFSSGVTAAANALSGAGTMITRINFSKKALVIASLGRPTVIFLVQMLIVAGLFAFYRIVPAKGVFLLPVVILPLVLFVLGCGFMFSLFNAFTKDVGNGLQVLMTFLMFLTPVLYAPPQSGFLGAITRYNPLYYMISAGRDLMIKGSIIEMKGFLISCAACFVLFFLSLIFFHLTETRVTERM